MSSLSILILASLLLFCFISALVGIWRLRWSYVAAITGVSPAVLKSKYTVAREGEPQPEIIDLPGQHEARETLGQEGARMPMIGPPELEHERC